MTTWSAWQPVDGFTDEEMLYDKKYRDRGGGIARLRFNRPHRMNAFHADNLATFVRGIEDANRDPDIGVIVVTSMGDHFGTGGDVQWEAEGGLQRPMPNFDGALKNSRKPTIAAVKGYCIGGHNHLAYHCDFTIAADTAIFGQNGPRVASPAHGMIVGASAYIMGVKRAKEMWMLCRQITAQRAYEMGLANEVVPLERLDETVDQWADELLDLVPDCLSVVKQTFEWVEQALAPTSGTLLAMIQPNFFQQPYVREAQQAFFEKRKPNFWPNAKKAADVQGS
ncbi:MAG TPA: enoyl-CoA hydratase-related protein [Dehalococcoidia bacterium]|nr:enoyl-CoA hydratase-related protein [Dehalococcoidia bacterium]